MIGEEILATIEYVESTEESYNVTPERARELYEARFIDDMWKAVKDLSGYGITAVQLGVPYKVSVYEYNGISVVFFNGHYSDLKRGRVQRSGGCLTYPSEPAVKVKRPKEVLAEYETWVEDQGLIPVKRKLKGFEARIFQHEVDHQLGKTIYKTKKGLFL